MGTDARPPAGSHDRRTLRYCGSLLKRTTFGIFPIEPHTLGPFYPHKLRYLRMEEKLLLMVEGLDVVELLRGPYIHGV